MLFSLRFLKYIRLSCNISLRKRVLPLKTSKELRQTSLSVQTARKICESLLKCEGKVPYGTLV